MSIALEPRLPASHSSSTTSRLNLGYLDGLRGGAAAFFKKRARRILPAYYLGLALSLLLDSFLIGKKTGDLG